MNETCTWCNAAPAVYAVVDASNSVSGYSCGQCAPNFMPTFFDAAGAFTVVPYPMRSAPQSGDSPPPGT